jgi:hypothetical protein
MSTLSFIARGVRHSRIVPAALLVLGAASFASAQTVTLRGKVEDVGTQFVLDCTPVTLVSGGANLAAVLGQDVEAVGTVIGPNLFSVTSVTPVTDVMELGGNMQLGGKAKIEVTGPVGQVVKIYAALDDAFLTVKKMGLFLDTASLSFLLQGTIPGTGKLEVTLTVPNDPALAGVDVFVQVVRLQAGGFQLGNSDCETIDA